MKNKTWILIAAAFALIMVLAVVSYPMLSEKYMQDGFDTEEQTTLPDTSTVDTGVSVPIETTSAGAQETTTVKEETVITTDDCTVYDAELNAVHLPISSGNRSL